MSFSIVLKYNTIMLGQGETNKGCWGKTTGGGCTKDCWWVWKAG